MLRRHALKILGLSDAAQTEDIRRAWRKKARLLHPDSPYGNIDAFHQAKTAFETLCPSPQQAIKRRIRVQASSRRA